jgi:hypothetical protein
MNLNVSQMPTVFYCTFQSGFWNIAMDLNESSG